MIFPIKTSICRAFFPATFEQRGSDVARTFRDAASFATAWRLRRNEKWGAGWVEKVMDDWWIVIFHITFDTFVTSLGVYTWYVPHFQIVLEFFGDLFWLCSMIHFGGGIRLSCSGIHSSISRWNHPTSCRRCSPEINGRCPAYGGRKTIPLSPKWS